MCIVTFMLDFGDQGDFAQFKSVNLNELNIFSYNFMPLSTLNTLSLVSVQTCSRIRIKTSVAVE